MIDNDGAPTAPTRKPGRPLAPRAPDGLPAKIRLTWRKSDGTPQEEIFSNTEAALRLMCAWTHVGCMPVVVHAETRSKNGWWFL